MSDRDPNMPAAFRSGSLEAFFWNLWPRQPPMTPEEKAHLDAQTEQWMQEQRVRDLAGLTRYFGVL